MKNQPIPTAPTGINHRPPEHSLAIPLPICLVWALGHINRLKGSPRSLMLSHAIGICGTMDPLNGSQGARD